jgi:hypothetical protein
MRWLLLFLLAAAPSKVDSQTSFQRTQELTGAGFKDTPFAVVASSTLCEGKGAKKTCHPVAALTDREVKTAWCEGAKRPGAGAQLTVTFEREVSLGGLELHPYFGKSFKLALANARPRLITVSGGGASHQFELEDVVATVEAQNADRPQPTDDGPCGDETCASRDERLPSMRLTVKFPAPLTAKTVTLRVDSIHEGDGYEDLCIAELRALARP